MEEEWHQSVWGQLWGGERRREGGREASGSLEQTGNLLCSRVRPFKITTLSSSVLTPCVWDLQPLPVKWMKFVTLFLEVSAVTFLMSRLLINHLLINQSNSEIDTSSFLWKEGTKEWNVSLLGESCTYVVPKRWLEISFTRISFSNSALTERCLCAAWTETDGKVSTSQLP